MSPLLAVALGAAAGAPSRYLVDLAVRRWCGTRLPWGTLAVNLTGSAAAGLAVGLRAGDAVAALVVVGFLGAFTTASTLALELLELPGRAAAGLLALHVVPGLALAALGLAVGRAVGQAL
jgi:CrcB protein